MRLASSPASPLPMTDAIGRRSPYSRDMVPPVGSLTGADIVFPSVYLGRPAERGQRALPREPVVDHGGRIAVWGCRKCPRLVNAPGREAPELRDPPPDVGAVGNRISRLAAPG